MKIELVVLHRDPCGSSTDVWEGFVVLPAVPHIGDQLHLPSVQHGRGLATVETVIWTAPDAPPRIVARLHRATDEDITELESHWGLVRRQR